MHIDERQAEFRSAMDRFLASSLYDNSGVFSVLIVGLQLMAVGCLLEAPLDAASHVAVFVAAYCLTDLWNGLLHLVLDNVTGYRTPVGPFIANFQLHHERSGYRRAHPLRVYFNETGDKKWLLPFLVAALCMEPGHLKSLFLEVAILSSVAEVAHYWSHAAQVGPVVGRMQRLGLLISPAEHRLHHTRDNTQYAFFTGWSNPVLNRVAEAFAPGYEDRTDRYAESYEGEAGKRE